MVSRQPAKSAPFSDIVYVKYLPVLCTSVLLLKSIWLWCMFCSVFMESLTLSLPPPFPLSVQGLKNQAC